MAPESRIQAFLNSLPEAFNPREIRVSPESVNEHTPQVGACELEFAAGFSTVPSRFFSFSIVLHAVFSSSTIEDDGTAAVGETVSVMLEDDEAATKGTKEGWIQ